MSSGRDACLLKESDLAMERGLRAAEVHRRLTHLAKAHQRAESTLCFYLHEVDERQLYIEYGHASTIDYARECLGFEDRKTRTLLHLAERFQVLPKMKEAFSQGEIPYTKAREALKVATPENEEEWVGKCKTMTNRQLEQEVKSKLPPVRKRLLCFVLEDERIDAWDHTTEALSRLAGKTLTDLEVLDLMCAEVSCTYDLTPPLGDPDQPMSGYVREVIERDGFRCTRPGCSNRTALTGNHIVPRSRGGSDDPSNLHTVCAVCHHAITTGRLKVSGKAPDQLTWEGPFGVIEKPLRPSASKSEPSAATEAPPSKAPAAEATKPSASIGDAADAVHEPSELYGEATAVNSEREEEAPPSAIASGPVLDHVGHGPPGADHVRQAPSARSRRLDHVRLTPSPAPDLMDHVSHGLQNRGPSHQVGAFGKEWLGNTARSGPIPGAG